MLAPLWFAAPAFTLLVSLMAPKATPTPPPPVTNDLRPALRALKAAKVTDGEQTVHTFGDTSRLVVTLAKGKAVSWSLVPARGTPDGVVNFDRAPDPKDKRRCAVLLARGAFTVEFTIDCAFAPPVK